MSYNRFTPTNCAPGLLGRAGGGAPKLFCRVMSRGSIVFSEGACILLGLKAGDRVAFEQDSQYPADWYAVRDPEGFVTLPAELGRSHMHGALKIESGELASRILGSVNGFGPDYNGARYPVKVSGDRLALCVNGMRLMFLGGRRRMKGKAGDGAKSGH